MNVFDTIGFIILSILFIVFVIGIIGVISFLKGKWRMSYLVKIRTLSTYVVGILFISLLYIVFVLPKVEAKDVYNNDHTPDIFNILIEKQQTAEVPDEYIKEKWNISMNNEELIIDTLPADEWGYFTDIIVEKRDDVRPEVEVTLYETPLLIGDSDISEKVYQNKIEINNNVITIVEQSEIIEIDYYGIENNLVTKQFIKNNPNDWQSAIFNFDVGQQVLYISAPKNISIKGDEDIFIEYVE